MREPITVTAADIARLTGYGRAAVSNWRRRHDDFPQPVGGTANSPLFALTEVEKWLTAQGKAMEVSPEEHLWQLIRTVADDLQLATVIADLGTGLAGEAHTPDKALAALHEETAAVAKRLGPADTFEFLVDRYVEAHSRRVLNTPAETAALMAELADIDGGSVLDPACGIGTLLLAALEHRPARILAQDRDEATAVITRIRLAMRGTPAALAVGDALRANGFPGERVDVVLCDPPFGDRAWGYDELTSDPRWTYGLPPRGESELAWVEHALWQLNPGGRAVVLMPSAAADRRSGRRIRAQLLRAGVLRAIIELPAGFASASAAPPHLWLLRRPAPDDPLPGHILKMNAASLDPREVRPAVVTRWRAFLQRPDDPQMSELSQAVPVVDLLDDVVDLTSTRHLTPPAAGEADYANARERLQASLTAANDAASALIPLLTEPEEVPMTTVSELIQSGAVSVRQSPVKMATDAGDLPMLTVKDVLVDRPPSGRTTDGPGVVILRRGDVVVPPATGRIEVAVVQADGAAAGPHLQVFRTDPERCDPYFLACFLRAAGLSRAGTTASRTDARRVPIPRLPLERQRPYGAAFQRLQALSAALRNLGDVGESLITLGFEGLAAGAMKPGS